MILNRTFFAATFFAVSLSVLMTMSVASLAKSNQGKIECLTSTPKSHARGSEQNLSRCKQNETSNFTSWLHDYLNRDKLDLGISDFATQTLDLQLKEDFINLTEEVEEYVFKHNVLKLTKSSITPGKHRAWTGIPQDNPGSQAFSKFLDGDVDGAFVAIEDGKFICGQKKDFRCSWRLELFKSRILHIVGRGADVESVLHSAGSMEENINGGRLITRASQGAFSLALGEYDPALLELASVAVEIGNWRFPSMRKGPDLERKLRSRKWMNNLYRMAEATARTHTALAKLFYYKKEYVQSIVWGSSALILMDNIFKFVEKRPDKATEAPVHAEVFLGTGETYAYMAAALLALEGKKEKPDELFSLSQSYLMKAGAFFGGAIVSATRAKAFFDANMIEDFLKAADEAVTLSSKIGFGELVWQIEALRGQVLLSQGKIDEAEVSLRRAQEAIDLVSGSLSSDRAKLKFGIGKDSVTQLLIKIDVQKGDLAALYTDLERGRARAFVDMIGESLVGGRQDRSQVEDIRKLDAQIRQRRLLLSVAGGVTDKQDLLFMFGENELISKRSALIGELRITNSDLADALSISTIALEEVEKQL